MAWDITSLLVNEYLQDLENKLPLITSNQILDVFVYLIF